MCESEGLALGPDLLGYHIILANGDDPLADAFGGFRGLADLLRDKFRINKVLLNLDHPILRDVILVIIL